MNLTVLRSGLPMLVATISMLAAGCAHYQYVLVQPSDANRVITSKQPVQVNYPPLVYQLMERDSHLTMQINNPQDTPLTLAGNRSYLVAPNGETHPLRGALIAPHSFIGMGFPPQQRVYRAYPSWGFGFGGPMYHHGPFIGSGIGFYNDPFFYGPPEYYMVNPPNYWEWKTGTVRLNLFYQQTATNGFEHQFVIERRKEK